MEMLYPRGVIIRAQAFDQRSSELYAQVRMHNGQSWPVAQCWRVLGYAVGQVVSTRFTRDD